MLNPSDPGERSALLTLERSDGAPGSRTAQVCAVWEFFRGVDLALVAETVEHASAPDFFGKILASGPDTVTVEVTAGVARYDYRILYFVHGRGAFELVARDVGPERGAIRVRLVLRAL